MTDVTPKEWGDLHLKLNRQTKQLARCVEVMQDLPVTVHAGTRFGDCPECKLQALLRELRGEGYCRPKPCEHEWAMGGPRGYICVKCEATRDA